MVLKFEELRSLTTETAKDYFKTDKFIVRVYDGFDNQWCDCTGPVGWDEALTVLLEKTKNGTHNTKFADIDYYSIFPAESRMLFSGGCGENVRTYNEDK